MYFAWTTDFSLHVLSRASHVWMSGQISILRASAMKTNKPTKSPAPHFNLMELDGAAHLKIGCQAAC